MVIWWFDTTGGRLTKSIFSVHHYYRNVGNSSIRGPVRVPEMSCTNNLWLNCIDHPSTTVRNKYNFQPFTWLGLWGIHVCAIIREPTSRQARRGLFEWRIYVIIWLLRSKNVGPDKTQQSPGSIIALLCIYVRDLPHQEWMVISYFLRTLITLKTVYTELRLTPQQSCYITYSACRVPRSRTGPTENWWCLNSSGSRTLTQLIRVDLILILSDPDCINYPTS